MVKPGYKRTEVGEIPEDWEITRIGDFAPLQRGFDLPNRDRVSGVYPVVYSNGIVNFHNEYQVKGPGVVTGRSGTIGKVHYIESDYWPHNTTLWVTRYNSAYPKYVYYLYLKVGFSRFSSGSGVPTLNRNDAHSFNIAVPKSIEEQKAIAKALSDVDELIVSLEKLIAKKHDIKTATMQQLLTGKKRLPGFGDGKGYKQTELGEIPEDWDVIKLGSNADITKLAGFEYTNHFNSYKDGGEVIVVRGTNITNNKLNLSDVKTIPIETSKKLPRSRLNKGDLVFAYVGTIGPVYLIDENGKFHLGPNTAKISCKSGLDANYLLVYFKSPYIKSEIEEKISVGAQPSLSMTKIRNFKIISPEKEEQQAIAKVLSVIDKEIEVLELKLEKIKSIKQGMMQELLTGRTRLVDVAEIKKTKAA